MTITTNNKTQHATHTKKIYRDISGILLLDKSTGISSNLALQKVKRLFQARKAGHTGSLDPLASGMLPICFGEATKFSQYLLNADKTYEVTAQLGVSTTTGDAEGEILEEKSVPQLTSTELENVLAQFRGPIQQIPPMYSALKHQGQPLYKLARQGITIERPPRAITIYELILITYNNNQLTLRVTCSKGTYIRSLIEDIGNVLQCGAHVTQLRRTQVSGFDPQAMIEFESLQKLLDENNEEGEKHFILVDKLLLPTAIAVTQFPKITVNELMAQRLQNGLSIKILGLPDTGLVAINQSNDQFIGLGEVTDHNQLSPRRLLRTI